MQVELKRTKITKSIVDQSLLGHPMLYYNFKAAYDILGWCVMIKNKRHLRYVLLYHRTTNEIVKLRYILNEKHIEIEKTSIQTPLIEGGYSYDIKLNIKAFFTDFNNSATIKLQNSESDDEILQIKERCEEFVKTSNQKGQIYL